MTAGGLSPSPSPRAERAPTRARRVGGVGLALPAGVPDFLQVPKRCPLQGSLRISRLAFACLQASKRGQGGSVVSKVNNLSHRRALQAPPSVVVKQ